MPEPTLDLFELLRQRVLLPTAEAVGVAGSAVGEFLGDYLGDYGAAMRDEAAAGGGMQPHQPDLPAPPRATYESGALTSAKPPTVRTPTSTSRETTGTVARGGTTTPGGATGTVARGSVSGSKGRTGTVASSAASQPTLAQPAAASQPATTPATQTGLLSWTEDETREITQSTVGRAMSKAELEAWLNAFYQEHGAYPWQTGPFDAHNNLVDHLIALGESEREVAIGSDYTKAGREGNVYAQPAITPDFWGDAYYSRYSGPTYGMGPGGPINTGSQRLMPGQLPPSNAPTELAYYGELSPRPYYQYRPAMSPGEWELPTPPAPEGMVYAGPGWTPPSYGGWIEAFGSPRSPYT